MRLIDADTLIESMEADAEHMDGFIGKMILYASINDVKHAPTIELIQKKGEWIKDSYHDYSCICSVCGIRQSSEARLLFSYCPICGADMRG